MVNYRPYESVKQRQSRRNKENEHAVLASGICAFISSYFANLIFSDSITPQKLYLTPVIIALYLIVYWLYCKCHEIVLYNSTLSKLLFGKLYMEDVIHIISVEIPSDLSNLIEDINKSTNNKELLEAKADYIIGHILEFLNHYSNAIYIGYENVPSVSSFVPVQTMEAIFNSIQSVIETCKTPNGARKDFETLERHCLNIKGSYLNESQK